MANDGFNGSTLKFPTATDAVGGIISMQFPEDGNEVDVTSLDSSNMEFVPGMKDIECTVEVVGVNTLTVGTTGAIAIAWFDGGTEAIATAILAGNDRGGSLNEKLSSSLRFKPTPA